MTNPLDELVEPSDRLAAAKILAWRIRPYFAAGYNALHPIPKPGLGTLAVDERWNLYYDPDIFTKWSFVQVASVLYHELCHLLREHHKRAKRIKADFDQELWNIAADMEINDDLVKEMKDINKGEELPPGCLPASFGFKDDEFAEYYYEELQKIPRKKMTLSAGSGSCGSCAHGANEDYEEAPGENSGLTEADGKLVTMQIANDIKDHATRKRGSVPGGWERWADELLQPKVDYLRWIRHTTRKAIQEIEGKADYSWRKRHRLQSAYGRMRMPGMTSHRASVGFVIDTSGSMSIKQVNQCVAEIDGALKSLGNQRIVVASCDADVHSLQHVSSIKALKLKGGGGTDMGVGIQKLEEVRPRLDLIICLTDCETPWPAAPPAYSRLLIVKIAGHGAPPPWRCDLIEIDLERWK